MKDITRVEIYLAVIILVFIIHLGVGHGSTHTKTLFDAIRQVESGGDDMAVGDGGRSKGPYQIGRDYWQDGCEYGGVDWDYDELVWDRKASEQIMTWYWARYKAVSDEQKARTHNGGGPKGMSKKATLKYWNKVQEAMK